MFIYFQKRSNETNIYPLQCVHMLRKPADRLGKVVFANEVSIRGSGGGSSREGPEARKLNFFGRHVPLRKEVTVGFDSP